MVHTSWTGKDGAPQGIMALCQTPDGTLWMGGISGIFSFDGVNFTPFNPRLGSPSLPISPIRFFFVSKSGDLWASPFHGAAIRIHDRKVQLYGTVDGDNLRVIGQLQQDTGGTLWSVLNEKHLVRLGTDDVWHQAPNPLIEEGHVSKLFIDSSDTLWVIENDLLYRKPEGETEFTPTNLHVYGQAKFVESQNHSLWVMGEGPTPAGALNLQHIDPFGQSLSAPHVPGKIHTILLAPDNSLWLNKHEELQRFSTWSEAGSHFKQTDSDSYQLKNGPTEYGLQALMSDADGNIWIGGMGGLDRFKPANLVPAFPNGKVGAWHSCVNNEAGVWVVNADNQLFVIKNGHASLIHTLKGTDNLFCGKENRVYVLDDSGIAVVRDRHIEHLPLLPGLTGYGDHYLFLGLIEHPGGDLIASVGGAVGQGLWKYHRGHWTRWLPDLALPEVRSIFEDARHSFFLAFTNDQNIVGKITNGSLEKLTVAIKPFGFTEASYGVLAFGGDGLAIDRGRRFQTLSLRNPERAKMMTGMAESTSGDLWINGARGIVRIPAVEVRAAIADSSYAMSSDEYQEGDFVGPDLPQLFRSSVHIDPRGHVLFSTLNGVVAVNPDRLAEAPHPPRLSIRSITADGHEIDASSAFPPETRTLDIKYFGLDLTDARRVVYRYRLESVGLNSRDSSWQDAGPRTEATYTNLRPGSYRFQVMASNGNEVWTRAVSSAMFRILPHFYERPWVQGMFVLTGVLLAWTAISLRLRYVAAAIRMRAEERADERVRIARELHDTLLQGVQGLLLSFHVAAEKVPADHLSKKALEKALTTADRIILEGRNRVSRLRADNLNDAELKSLIESVAANFNSVRAIEFAVERTGGSEILRSHVVDEVFCIAREALTNAFRHSEASRIVVELDYQKGEFRMSCRDNGRGFDRVALSANQTNGHWGLHGMAERAQSIGANFACTSDADQGTEIQVRVPARLAYARSSRLGQLFGSRLGA